MLDGLVRSRFVAYRLTLRDIKVEYSRSAFGMLWDLVDPIVLGIIFYFLAIIRVIRPGDLGMPYAIFLVYGMMIYQSFCDGLLYSLDSIHRARDLLAHQKLPPEAMILSVFYRALFNSSFRIVVMLLFSIGMRGQALRDGVAAFSPGGFALMALLFPLIIFAGLSFGVFLSPFNGVYRDIGRVTRIILNPLRYLTPVLFTFPKTGPGALVYLINPIASPLDDLRQLAVAGQISHGRVDLAWLVVWGCLFCVGWVVFHLAIPVIAERT